MPNPSLAVTYLDHNASSPLTRELVGEVGPLFERSQASPSSLHSQGRTARRLINEAAEAVSDLIRCTPEDLYWTSGASEANSWVFHSVLQLVCFGRPAGRPPRLLVSAIEHDSTLNAVRSLVNLGATVQIIPADSNGVISLEALERLLSASPAQAGGSPDSPSGWDMVSVMHSNNETGVIQPIEKIAALAHRAGALVHVDAVQALGKYPISVQRGDADYLSFSGHKVGAPRGVGFLVMTDVAAERVRARFGKTAKPLSPMIHGKQQKALRGGTENPFSVGLLGRVARHILATGVHLSRLEKQAAWHRAFEAKVKELIPGTIVHGEAAPRLGNTSYLGFNGTDGDGILMNLDLAGICASAGSACTSGSLDPSHVLLAMGCDKAMARSSVRFSSGPDSSWADFERALSVLPEIVDRVRASHA